jgi:hypothetical protein
MSGAMTTRVPAYKKWLAGMTSTEVGTCYDSRCMRSARIVSSHAEARKLDVTEWARMSKEERLRLGAELHAFWVRNYHPHAVRLDRTVQVVRRPVR